jgi:hypothetical protein
MDRRNLETLATCARYVAGTDGVRRLIAEAAKLPPLGRSQLDTVGRFAFEFQRLHARLLERCQCYEEQSQLADISGQKRVLLEHSREECEALATELGELLRRLFPDQ